MNNDTVYITKPFMSGRSQAIRIPKEFRMSDAEVVINRIGESLIITPKEALATAFYSGINMLPDDFLSSGRPEEITNSRETL
ncbi:MAG: AbrB/MazE/SpoVT family DNA-binding domain-containing protein [Eubacterium sp.]|nr:AbrB/MazE/SpoVT family DNA-binding domain-containing protein [Eubacterium sp.]